jgi:transcriptional regulator GlxA family with amidase domain
MANDADATASAAEVHLGRLQRMVQENLSDPRLDVRMLASTLGVSVRTVYSAFATIDVTPAQYIRRQRVEAAAVRLRSSLVPITDLAISLGFDDVTTFARCFRRLRGVTPSQWRRTAR